ncbi:MAG: hypothetical protein FWG65_05865, partial [Turicibacter sp.]|nr:hypothetical protein [Turicibacter sp.]
QQIHVDLSQAPGWTFSVIQQQSPQIVLTPPTARRIVAVSDVNFDILVPPNWKYNIENGNGGGFVVSFALNGDSSTPTPPEPEPPTEITPTPTPPEPPTDTNPPPPTVTANPGERVIFVTWYPHTAANPRVHLGLSPGFEGSTIRNPLDFTHGDSEYGNTGYGAFTFRTASSNIVTGNSAPGTSSLHIESVVDWDNYVSWTMLTNGVFHGNFHSVDFNFLQEHQFVIDVLHVHFQFERGTPTPTPSPTPAPIGGVTIVQPPHTGGAFPPPIIDVEDGWSATPPTTQPNGEIIIYVTPNAGLDEDEMLSNVDITMPPGWEREMDITVIGGSVAIRVTLRPPVVGNLVVNVNPNATVDVVPDLPNEGWDWDLMIFQSQSLNGIFVSITPPSGLTNLDRIIVNVPPSWLPPEIQFMPTGMVLVNVVPPLGSITITQPPTSSTQIDVEGLWEYTTEITNGSTRIVITPPSNVPAAEVENRINVTVPPNWLTIVRSINHISTGDWEVLIFSPLSTTFFIHNADDWTTLANMTTAERSHFVRVELMADISIVNTIIPGEFNAAFGGNGFRVDTTITNAFSMTVNSLGGLFEEIGTGGTVRNVHVVANITWNNNSMGGTMVGGLVGRNLGLIEIVAVNGNLNVNNNNASVGGVSGGNGGTINRTLFDGTIQSNSSAVGGIAGDSGGPNGLVSNSYSVGNVQGEGMAVGGVVGVSNGRVLRTFSTAVVENIMEAGGIVGLNMGSVENSVALNHNIIGDGMIPWGTNSGRIVSNDIHFNGGTLMSNHAPVTVLINGVPVPEDDPGIGATSIHGANMIGMPFIEWLSLFFGLGFSEDNGWTYSGGWLRHLAGLPASVVQNPQAPPWQGSFEDIAFNFDFDLDFPQEGYDEEFFDLDLDDLLLLTPEIGIDEDGEAIVIHPEFPEVDEDFEEEPENDTTETDEAEDEKKEPEPEPEVVLGDPEPDEPEDEYPEDTYNDYDNTYKDIDPAPEEDLVDLEFEDVDDVDDIDDIDDIDDNPPTADDLEDIDDIVDSLGL